jgi:hypothetical protein
MSKDVKESIPRQLPKIFRSSEKFYKPFKDSLPISGIGFHLSGLVIVLNTNEAGC